MDATQWHYRTNAPGLAAAKRAKPYAKNATIGAKNATIGVAQIGSLRGFAAFFLFVVPALAGDFARTAGGVASMKPRICS